MARYDLVGVDGNAFSIMGYTANALKETGHRNLVPQMREEAMSGDYNNLLCVCIKYIDIANDSCDADEDFDGFIDDSYEDMSEVEFDD